MSAIRKRTIICIAVGLAVALTVVGIIALSNSNAAPSPAELLSLGEKYLSELDYEQALVQFLKVIEIEPMNERAYLGAAEAYIGLGQTGEAIAILERGLISLPESAAIADMLEQLRPTTTIEAETDFQQEPEIESAPPAGVSETMALTGIIIDNSVEYEEQWKKYIAEYQDTDVTGNTRVSVAAYGIRFSESIEVSIDGNKSLVDEAMINNGDLGETWESMKELCGKSMSLTGYFEFIGNTEVFSGPRRNENDGYIYYDYRPNGDYVFIPESRDAQQAVPEGTEASSLPSPPENTMPSDVSDLFSGLKTAFDAESYNDAINLMGRISSDDYVLSKQTLKNSDIAMSVSGQHFMYFGRMNAGTGKLIEVYIDTAGYFNFTSVDMVDYICTGSYENRYYANDSFLLKHTQGNIRDGQLESPYTEVIYANFGNGGYTTLPEPYRAEYSDSMNPLGTGYSSYYKQYAEEINGLAN